MELSFSNSFSGKRPEKKDKSNKKAQKLNVSKVIDSFVHECLGGFSTFRDEIREVAMEEWKLTGPSKRGIP